MLIIKKWFTIQCQVAQSSQSEFKLAQTDINQSPPSYQANQHNINTEKPVLEDLPFSYNDSANAQSINEVQSWRGTTTNYVRASELFYGLLIGRIVKLVFVDGSAAALIHHDIINRS